jgi:hypothetical protein
MTRTAAAFKLTHYSISALIVPVPSPYLYWFHADIERLFFHRLPRFHVDS